MEEGERREKGGGREEGEGRRKERGGGKKKGKREGGRKEGGERKIRKRRERKGDGSRLRVKVKSNTYFTLMLHITLMVVTRTLPFPVSSMRI